MSEPTPSSPPGGQAAAKSSTERRGRLLAFLGWLALLCGIAVFAAASFVRSEHRAEVDRRYALADEQRSAARTAAALAEGLAEGSIPAVSDVSDLRSRSLEVLARIPPEPEAALQAEWTQLAAGVDALLSEWGRILDFRSMGAALRDESRALLETTDRLAAVLSVGEDGLVRGAEALALASRRFADEVDRASLAEPAHLDRARELLDLLVRVRGFLAAEISRQPPAPPARAGRTPTLHTDIAALDARIDAASERLGAIRSTAETLGSVSAEVRQLAQHGARVMALLPEFEARARREPTFFEASLDAWILRSAVLAVAGLIGLFWRRQRLLRAEAAGLDRAWGEAAGSDWHARDLLRAIDSLDRRPGERIPHDSEDLEGCVREAKASLPRIVARRAQLAAALLSAREPLGKRISAARESVLANLDSDPGNLDTAPLLEIEVSFREATLFALAAVTREIRAAATGDAGSEEAPRPSAHASNGPDTVHAVVARGFDLLEWSLGRVLAGEEEERNALIFLLDDLRAVRGKTPFSASLDFDPPLARPPETGRPEADPSDGAGLLRTDAARMLPSFRKGRSEWTAGDGDGASGAMLVRGSVSVLARAAEERMSPSRTFWNVAAAFCTALCERAVPAGPAVRRIMGEVAREFEATAERENPPRPPERLLRELLLYIALADSDHEELQAVRTAFELERYPLAIPERPVETDLAEGKSGGDISMEIIQQLEGIRAALDRIDGPPEGSSQPPPSP